MKTLLVTIALAIASPALAWDDNDISARLSGLRGPTTAAGHGQRQATAMQQPQQRRSLHWPTYGGCAAPRTIGTATEDTRFQPSPPGSNLGVFIEGPEGIGS